MLESAGQIDFPQENSGNPMIFDIQCNESDRGLAILIIQGDIDMDTCTQVQNHLMNLYKNNPKVIVVDLSKVSYIDSFGIATLVEGLQWSHNNEAKFRLTSLTPAVKDVFKIANLLTVFEIFDSREDALKGL